jgi:hypothetical protein
VAWLPGILGPPAVNRGRMRSLPGPYCQLVPAHARPAVHPPLAPRSPSGPGPRTRQGRRSHAAKPMTTAAMMRIVESIGQPILAAGPFRFSSMRDFGSPKLATCRRDSEWGTGYCSRSLADGASAAELWTRPSPGRTVVITVDEPAVRIFRWLAHVV